MFTSVYKKVMKFNAYICILKIGLYAQSACLGLCSLVRTKKEDKIEEKIKYEN